MMSGSAGKEGLPEWTVGSLCGEAQYPDIRVTTHVILKTAEWEKANHPDLDDDQLATATFHALQGQDLQENILDQANQRVKMLVASEVPQFLAGIKNLEVQYRATLLDCLFSGDWNVKTMDSLLALTESHLADLWTATNLPRGDQGLILLALKQKREASDNSDSSGGDDGTDGGGVGGGDGGKRFQQQVMSLTATLAGLQAAQAPPTFGDPESYAFTGAAWTANSFVTVPHLSKAFGPPSPEEKLLFIREETAELWGRVNRQMQDPDNSGMTLVWGPPGTGKSSSIFAWVLAVGKSKRVLWLHQHPRPGLVFGVEVADGKLKSVVTDVDGATKLVRAFAGDIIVVDGVRSKSTKLSEKASQWQVQGQDRQVVVVSSAQVVIPGESGVGQVFVPSWTTSDYQQACTHPDFFAAVRDKLGCNPKEELTPDNIREAVTAKAFIAGGCARWMFGMSPAAAEDDIRQFSDRVQDPKALIDGTAGAKADSATNHCIAMFRSNDRRYVHCVVSQEVLRGMVGKTNDAFYTELTQRSQMTGNPAFDGWVFELDVLDQFVASKGKEPVKLEAPDATGDGTSTVFQYEIVATMYFWNLTDIHLKHLQPGTLLLPRRWNQGGYDAILIGKNGKVIFFQISRGETHDLKLRYMVRVMRRIAHVAVTEAVDTALTDPADDNDRGPDVAREDEENTKEGAQKKLLRIEAKEGVDTWFSVELDSEYEEDATEVHEAAPFNGASAVVSPEGGGAPAAARPVLTPGIVFLVPDLEKFTPPGTGMVTGRLPNWHLSQLQILRIERRGACAHMKMEAFLPRKGEPTRVCEGKFLNGKSCHYRVKYDESGLCGVHHNQKLRMEAKTKNNKRKGKR